MALNDRIEWIDTSKGIGIILVVLGHIWLMREGYNYINSFHVPLFFFLSGYLVNFEKYDGLRSYIIAKVNNLLIPYFSFSLLTYVYWILIERKFSENTISPTFAFLNIFISPGGEQYLPHSPTIWCFTCLFIATIIFYKMARKQNSYQIFILLLVSSAVGYATTLYVPNGFPWSIDVAPTGIVFYGVGFIMKKSNTIYIKSNYTRLLIPCCCIPAGFIISQLNGSVLMADNLYGNHYFYFYITAFLGIASVVTIAMLFGKNRVLSYLGQNSLIIFALHFPVKRVVTGVTSKVLNVSLEQIKGSFLIGSIETVITILLLVPIIYLIRNQCPFILSKKSESNSVEKEVRQS